MDPLLGVLEHQVEELIVPLETIVCEQKSHRIKMALYHQDGQEAVQKPGQCLGGPLSRCLPGGLWANEAGAEGFGPGPPSVRKGNSKA